MTGRHRRTLERIFARPTAAGIRWAEVESLMRALGVDLAQGSGSRIRFSRDGVSLVVHRPHPGPEVGRATIRAIAGFLSEIGVAP